MKIPQYERTREQPPHNAEYGTAWVLATESRDVFKYLHFRPLLVDELRTLLYHNGGIGEGVINET